MDSNTFWQVFWETGSPEAYLLYAKARHMEEADVFNDRGACPSDNGLQ